MRRVFVVGCPRSGTTLVQSCLAAHPDVVSWSETHFFARVVSSSPVLRALPLDNLPGRLRQGRVLAELGLPGPGGPGGLRDALRRPVGAALVASMDALAAQAGVGTWVEKTPSHLSYLPYVRAAAPDAEVVHVVRHGEQVVRSLVRASGQSPDAWAGARTPLQVAHRWSHDVRTSLADAAAPGSHFVRYEHLATRPAPVVAALLHALGLEASADVVAGVLRRRQEVAGRLIRPDEPWKGEARRPIRAPAEGPQGALLGDDVRDVLADGEAAARALPFLAAP